MTSCWDECIATYGKEVATFFGAHFADTKRRCLIVGGAGFDPRCVTFAQLLHDHLGARLDGFFLREHRPDPSPELVTRADVNIATLKGLVSILTVKDIEVLAKEDKAVIGGRRAVQALDAVPLAPYTDIIIDFSALSVGISFPVARLLLEKAAAEAGPKNVHVVVASNAGIDDAVRVIPSDVVDPVHGFSALLDLQESAQEPKIWMPALAFGKGQSLELIRAGLRGPVTVCPVLPISQRDPRTSDRLIADYEDELYQSWEVPASNTVFPIEDDPLDLYRTITSIYKRYTKWFQEVERAHVVLTPSGSKTLAIGALMAAIEHELPVRYVEAVDYVVSWPAVDGAQKVADEPIHVWLSGEAYPKLAPSTAVKSL